jgi:hypothetical protein
MPRQNRVTPFGDIVAEEGRGLLMGNRGILHDDTQRVVRHAQGRRWIACVTEFRGRRRQLMRPGSYTELFFLDEAAALAAGHRPCAECRHADYVRFRDAWASWHPGLMVSANTIDAELHRDRLAGRGAKRTYAADPSTLPDGAFIALDGRAWLIWQGHALQWSSRGYLDLERRAVPRGSVPVLTPQSIVTTIQAGYRPAVHPTALRP